MIHYKLSFRSSLEVGSDLRLGHIRYGGSDAIARHFELSGYNFSFVERGAVRGNIDFSRINFSGSGAYALNFDFAIYANVDTRAGSNFLVSLRRSTGSSGQRNSHKMRIVSFFGKNNYLLKL
jgi:hypothetical protein